MRENLLYNNLKISAIKSKEAHEILKYFIAQQIMINFGLF